MTVLDCMKSDVYFSNSTVAIRALYYTAITSKNIGHVLSWYTTGPHVTAP